MTYRPLQNLETQTASALGSELRRIDIRLAVAKLTDAERKALHKHARNVAQALKVAG